MARKNIHGKAGVRFKAGYTVSKDRNMLRNVSTDLIIYACPPLIYALYFATMPSTSSTVRRP